MSQFPLILGAGTVTPRDVEALSPQPLQRTRKVQPTPDTEEISDLVLEESQSEPTKEATGTSKKTETIELKTPIDIVNLIPRNVLLTDAFSRVQTTVYDISSFSRVKYHLGRVGYDIRAQYPGYEYKIYTYRATKRFQGTVVSKLKLDYNVDKKKKFVHVNVELLE